MSAQILKRSKKTAVPAVLVAAVFYLAALTAAFALEPVNKTSDGVAIKGYDPVAYFTDGKPVEGSKAFEHVWMGARWHFSSPAHRDLFIGDPEKFAPEYGGY
jgi:hypothetical protein